MELSEGSQSFTQMLRGLDDLEPNLSERDSQNQTVCSAESSQSPSHYCRPDRPKRRITGALCTLNEDIDAILPFCSNGFTLTPPRNQATNRAQHRRKCIAKNLPGPKSYFFKKRPYTDMTPPRRITAQKTIHTENPRRISERLTFTIKQGKLMISTF
ncbi:uncharacterized protein isoform X2 [Salmo salar]|uniref:Uncharacterized protein isoform X2 n=1 Tax=Salmo salar TaxID=8030 RepID=A0ABM3DH17_SALSA|nr:uncharacterized protein LOC106593136 isoform X2 [Salmo salar]